MSKKQRIGAWIIIDDCEKFIAKCSKCGRVVDSRLISKFPYCRCVTKMEEAERKGSGEMRDILFRGMTEDGKWVEGYYACATDKNNLKQHNILKSDCIFGYFDWTVVLPETVGQYTGLCDKNGVKIFEGDIVENISGERDYIGVVRYCKAHFVIEWGRLKDVLRNDLHFWASERKLEVIGNIYENKELLEAVK